MWAETCQLQALSAGRGLLFVALLEKGVAEGDVASDFSAVLAERVKLLFSFLFGHIINHLCSERRRCYSPL